MSFFSQHELLVYPYTVFSDAGNITLEVLTVVLPLAYCSGAGKSGGPGIAAGFGFVAFYSGLMVSSVLFVFIPNDLYKPMLGVALLASLAAVYAIFALTEAYEKIRRAALSKTSAANAAQNIQERYGFSPKEREVMELLSAGVITSEIAAKMRITERTVNFHVGSLLKKTGSKNRVELVAKVKNGHAP
jgi:DNA-binding CsgD family transcriptional regulator